MTAALFRTVTRRMRIQYMSDLHLEFGCGPPRMSPVAPILVLAGDIGNPCQAVYRDFLSDCARSWEHVVVVAGNHEFYNKHAADRWVSDTVADRLAVCRAAAAAAGPNVHFLERDRVIIGDLAFLGCTLWSDVTGAEALVERGMSDYHVICAEGPPWRKLHAADVKAWHVRDRAWLTAELAACHEEGRGAVVVTHHLPTYDLIAARYQGHPLNAGFASALDDLICEPVRAWICGHSHVGSIVFKGPTGRIPCALNPRGYPLERGTGFCGDLFVDVMTGAGPGEDERNPELVSSTLDESGSAPSLQRPEAVAQSSAAAGTPPSADSESDTSPESVVFL
jgi:hypothetical protein